MKKPQSKTPAKLPNRIARADAHAAKPAKAPKEKPFKLPAKLPQVADLAYELRAKRLEVQKVAAAIGKQETACKEFIVQNLDKNKSTGVSGLHAHASITRTPVAAVRDHEKLWAWINKSPARKKLYILPPAISMEALNELAEDEKAELPPGVERFNVIKVSLTKV